MKQRLKFFFLALILGLVHPALAEDQSNWMSRVDDNTFVSLLSIPGAHDAATGHGTSLDNFARTQDITITEMWNAGVRAFDLRPCVQNNDLAIYHGSVSTNISFKQAVTTLCNLLDSHPTELAIIVMRHEDDSDNGDASWNTLMTTQLTTEPVKSHAVAFKTLLKMSEARGKLLVLSRNEYRTTPVGGFITGWGHNANFNNQQGGVIKGKSGSTKCYIQDFYDCSASDGPETKKNSVARMLQFSCTENTNPNIWVINHTSGYSKTFFGAATRDGYRDNAATQNTAAINYLSQHPGPTGIVMMDCAGVDRSENYNVKGLALVKALIDNNFKEGQHTAYFRALSAIATGKKYRVTTEYRGTKYYLTTSGYLDADGANAGAFTFLRTAGEAYYFGFKLKDSYFTNPGLDNGTVVFKSGHINTYTGTSRATWEAQVFYKNAEGKYAIRSTNANSGTSSWALTAGTYWTVNKGSKGPIAEYSNDQNYIWGIEDASIVPDAVYQVEGDEESIEAWNGDREGLYDLNGRQVRSSLQPSSSIPRGIYLLKGKKVLIQ